MMVDVHLTDGRTVFRCRSRGQAIRLFKRDPDVLDEQGVERVWVRWHPQAEWEPVELLMIKKHSASFVRAVKGGERAEFESAFMEKERPTPERPDPSIAETVG